MLLKIHEGTELPKLLVIKDCVAVKDASYFFSCVANRCKHNFPVHCFLHENSEFHFRKLLNPVLPQDHTSSIVVHDLFSDPFSWNSKQNNPVDKVDTAMAMIANQNGVVVALDSHLSLKNNQTQTLYKRLLQMKSQPTIVQIILMVHVDLLTPQEASVLDYLSDASVTMSNEHLMVERLRLKSASKREDGSTETPIAKVLLKRNTGKVVTSLESFHVSTSFSLESKPWVFDTVTTESNSNMDDHEKEDSSDLPNDVTFKLSLSKAEQQQRNKLVMPYTPGHKVEIKVEDSCNNNKAQIFYEPDEEDDFDDEDPDDDLEF